MEKHGIGTDASIPTHINNILVRNYVTLGQGRTLVPTELGIVLVHGYQRIDPHLVLPDTRAAIEASCDRIARGLASKPQVPLFSIYFQNNDKIFIIILFVGAQSSAVCFPRKIRTLSSVHWPDGFVV